MDQFIGFFVNRLYEGEQIGDIHPGTHTKHTVLKRRTNSSRSLLEKRELATKTRRETRDYRFHFGSFALLTLEAVEHSSVVVVVASQPKMVRLSLAASS
jgi:hypothetical protein